MADDAAVGSTYRVFGRVLPERRGWWFDTAEALEVDANGDPLVRITSVAVLSNFSAEYWLRTGVRPDLSLADAKNIMEAFVRVQLDTIGLLEGAAVDCDVVHVEGPNGERLFLDSIF